MTAADPRFYFSLRSPYSWLAQHDLAERYPDVAARTCWRPFWEPDEHSQDLLDADGGKFLYTPMTKEKHLYILQDVRRLAEERDLAVSWPVDRDPHWEVPHLPYFLAEGAGVGREYVAAVSRARWELGQDICDPAVITRIGAGLGLDPTRVRWAPEDPALREQAGDALLALHHDGVFGVPFFVVGRDKFWGVDRLPAFAAKLRQRFPAPRAAISGQPVGVAAASFDDGHAGGCG
jgi:2-hydroxychromene-2-carboxylate isomerase